MFCTAVEFEEHVPRTGLVPGTSTWRAALVPPWCSHWFVVICGRTDAASDFRGSMLVATEEFMLDLLAEDSPMQALSISALSLDRESLEWKQQQVDGVWTAAVPAGEVSAGTLVFTLKGDPTVRTWTLSEADRVGKGARLFSCQLEGAQQVSGHGVAPP